MDKNYIAQLRPHIKSVHSILMESENSDDMKGLAILNILIRHWESDKKVTQQDIADEVTQIGHHDLWEGRMGASNDTTLRKVRQVIERLRKQYSLPIMSTPGKGLNGRNTAGYWLVRERHEAVEYAERRQGEINKTTASAKATLATVRRVCQIDA